MLFSLLFILFSLLFSSGAWASTDLIKQRAAIEAKISEALRKLSHIEQGGAQCSKYFIQTGCPRTFPQAIRDSFVRVNIRDLNAYRAVLNKELNGLVAYVSQPVSENTLAGVDACRGAAEGLIKDLSPRKQALEEASKDVGRIINGPPSGFSENLTLKKSRLFTSSAEMTRKFQACGQELSIFSMFAGASAIPRNIHEGLMKAFAVQGAPGNCQQSVQSSYRSFAMEDIDDLITKVTALQAYLNTNAKNVGVSIEQAKARLAKCSGEQPASVTASKPSSSPVASPVKPSASPTPSPSNGQASSLDRPQPAAAGSVGVYSAIEESKRLNDPPLPPRRPSEEEINPKGASQANEQVTAPLPPRRPVASPAPPLPPHRPADPPLPPRKP